MSRLFLHNSILFDSFCLLLQFRHVSIVSASLFFNTFSMDIYTLTEEEQAAECAELVDALDAMLSGYPEPSEPSVGESMAFRADFSRSEIDSVFATF